MIYVELKLRLAELLLMRVDKITMATSVETRVPFLDHKLVEFAMTIPRSMKVRDGQNKWVLKKALEGIVDHDLLYRPKQGFGLPINEWFIAGMLSFVEHALFSSPIRKRGFFDYDFVRSIWKQHLAGKVNYSFNIWSLLNLSLWYEHWIERRPFGIAEPPATIVAPACAIRSASSRRNPFGPRPGCVSARIHARLLLLFCRPNTTPSSSVKKMQRVLLSLLGMVFAVPAFTATASAETTYFVEPAPAGNDANPGTEVQPFATIQKAANVAVAGDTVVVKAGTYAGAQFATSGTAVSPIVVRGEDGAKVTSPGAANTNLAGLWAFEVSYVTIQNFEVSGCPRRGHRRERLSRPGHRPLKGCRGAR